jgi:hypothetical protein
MTPSHLLPPKRQPAFSRVEQFLAMLHLFVSTEHNMLWIGVSTPYCLSEQLVIEASGVSAIVDTPSEIRAIITIDIQPKLPFIILPHFVS